MGVITHLILTAIIGFGLCLRMVQLDGPSLWFGEAGNWYNCTLPVPRMLAKIAQDMHPPFYPAMLRIWMWLAGESVTALRLLSVISGTLCIPAAYWLVRAGTQRNVEFKNTALFAALLCASNGFLVYYSQQVLVYSFLTLVALVSTALLFEALAASRSVVIWLLYGTAIEILLYTHHFGWLTYLSHAALVGCLGIVFKDHCVTMVTGKRFIVTSLAILLCYLPWAPVAFRQFADVERDFWMPPWKPPHVFDSIIHFVFGSVERSGPTLWAPECEWLARLITFLVVSGILVRLSRDRWTFVHSVLMMVSFPAMMLCLLCGYKQNLWVTYALQPILCGVLIIIPCVIHIVSKKQYVTITVAMYVTVSVLMGCYSQYQWTSKYRPPGIRRAAELLNSSVQDQDLIILNPSRIHYSMLYYLDRKTNCNVVGPPWEAHHVNSVSPNAWRHGIVEHEARISYQELLATNARTVWVVEGVYKKAPWPIIPPNWTLVSSHRFTDWYPPEIIVECYSTNVTSVTQQVNQEVRVPGGCVSGGDVESADAIKS